MVKDWKRDLTKSAEQFVNIVYPEIKDSWFDGADIAPVESVSKRGFDEELDQLAGIDYWVVKTKTGMRGLASRVQTQSDWSTFTVRYSRPSGVDTEYQKRKQAKENGYLRPHWTLQAYVPENSLENVARCRTDELIEYIDQGELKTDYTQNDTGGKYNTGEQFYVVHWNDYKRRYWIDHLKPLNNNKALKDTANQTLTNYAKGKND